MALVYKNSLPIGGIAVPLFTLFLAVAFELSLQLSALLALSLSLSLDVSLVLPTIEIALGVAINLILEFNLALSFMLPDFTLNLSLALDFELTLVLGFIAVLEGLINALAGVNLCAYGWLGPGADLGPNLDATIGGGWPDGTPSSNTVSVYLFVATTRGSFTPDQVQELSLMAAPPVSSSSTPPPPPQGALPPVPSSPVPPSGAYPPPQSYEAGLAGVVIDPPPPGGTQATGTVTLDNSVGTGIGAITAVTIVDHGSGYASAPKVAITDSVGLVSATVASPIVVTLPNALTIPVGHGFGVTVTGVQGSTTILDAVPGTTDQAALQAAAQAAEGTATTPNPTAAQAALQAAAAAAGPIVITVASTTGLVSAYIPPPSPADAYGISGLNGLWYCKILSPTTAELWADASYTLPSQGRGTYTPSSASLSGNICGLQHAKVITPTTIALYQDAALSIPVVGYGTYSGGTVTGAGTGAAATCTMGGGAVNALQSLINGLPWPQTEGLSGGVIEFSVMLAAIFDLMKLLLGNLKARAALLGGASAGIAVTPPSVAASLQLLAQISANLRANLNVKLPSLSASAHAALTAQINAIASLTASIGFFLGMTKSGLGLELEVWQYTGPGSGLGAAIAAGPGTAGWHDGTAPSVPVVAGVFGLTTTASATAFSSFFAGA